MSIYLALSKTTNDLIFPPEGGVSRVNDGRFIIQQVRSKLKTWLGEWILNPNIGWVNLEDFVKDYDLYNIEDRARVVILSVVGVESIIEITATYRSRKLEIDFKANTVYGEINLNIPWGVS